MTSLFNDSSLLISESFTYLTASNSRVSPLSTWLIDNSLILFPFESVVSGRTATNFPSSPSAILYGEFSFASSFDNAVKETSSDALADLLIVLELPVLFNVETNPGIKAITTDKNTMMSDCQ